MIGKKGVLGDAMMLPAVFIIMILIAIGMIVGVYLYLGNGYDFRLADANALNHKIRNCMYSTELLNKNLDIFETCGIKKESVENHKLFFKICADIDSEECSSSEVKIYQAGSNFESCFINGVRENSNYPICKSTEIVINGKSFSIITGSNQQLKRESLDTRAGK